MNLEEAARQTSTSFCSASRSKRSLFDNDCLAMAHCAGANSSGTTAGRSPHRVMTAYKASRRGESCKTTAYVGGAPAGAAALSASNADGCVERSSLRHAADDSLRRFSALDAAGKSCGRPRAGGAAVDGSSTPPRTAFGAAPARAESASAPNAGPSRPRRSATSPRTSSEPPGRAQNPLSSADPQPQRPDRARTLTSMLGADPCFRDTARA
mmetsp:Transcript_18921/g.63938  ORF Transcript_18921/g.63938 Transcript_18921/m.63938 type:complete len:211 (+) Transcript_18921:26-658(+)